MRAAEYKRVQGKDKFSQALMQALSPRVAAQLRHMVETQIAPLGVRLPALYDALQAVPRAAFLPEPLAALGLMDEHVRLIDDSEGAPRWLLRTAALAVMIEMLAPAPTERGLDIGCNCGYSTALLSLLGESAIGIEENPELAALAAQRLEQCEAETAAIIAGAHRAGHAKSAPYDYVLVNGSCPLVTDEPPPFARQLRPGGRLVCGQFVRGRAAAVLYRCIAGAGTTSGSARVQFVPLEERDLPLPPLCGMEGAGRAREQGFAKARGFA